MTMNATLLKDTAVSRPDHQGVMKVLQRKRFRMSKAVLGLDRIFSNQVMRCVAIIASGDGMMTGFGPTVVIVTHDMTIRARGGIIAQVGETFAIGIGIGAASQHDSKQRAQDQSGNTGSHDFSGRRFHQAADPFKRDLY